MRYFLFDRIDEMKPLEWAVGTKCISLADDCFEHHFPGQPVYPGALLVEGLAQLGGALLELSLRDRLDYTPRCVMSKVEARFRHFVQPGDVLTLRADVHKRRGDESAIVKATARRIGDGRRICEAEILYLFIRIDDPRLEASRRELLEIVSRGTRVHPAGEA